MKVSWLNYDVGPEDHPSCLSQNVGACLGCLSYSANTDLTAGHSAQREMHTHCLHTNDHKHQFFGMFSASAAWRTSLQVAAASCPHPRQFTPCNSCSRKPVGF